MPELARAAEEVEGTSSGWSFGSGRFLREALDGVADAVTITAGSGELLYANRRALLLLGQPATPEDRRVVSRLAALEPAARNGHRLTPEELPLLRVSATQPIAARVVELRFGPTRRRVLMRSQWVDDGSTPGPVVLTFWHDHGGHSVVRPRRRARADRESGPGSPLTSRLALLLGAPGAGAAALQEAAAMLARAFGSLCVIDLFDSHQDAPVRIARTSRPEDVSRAWVLEDASHAVRDTETVRWLVTHSQFSRFDDFGQRSFEQRRVWAFPSQVQVDALTAMGIETIMGVPVRCGSAARGLLTVCRASGDPRWTRQDELLLDEAATCLGFAVERDDLLSDLRTALSARDEFLSEAAHELRAPIHALLLYLQSTVRKLGDHQPEVPAWFSSRVSACVRQTQQLRDLVSRLLDLSRLSGRRQVSVAGLDLRSMMVDLADRLGDTLSEAQCELRMELDQVVCATDRVWLEEVVVNLLENACKYGRGRPLEIQLRRRAEFVELSIRDHGPGILAADRALVFARYERGSNVGDKPGWGLGLYVAREIVTVLGGRLELRDTAGGGATFVIVLPVEGPRGT